MKGVTENDAIGSPAVVGEAHLVRVFGAKSLLIFGLAYLVPLTVFATFGNVSRVTQGHLPLAYVVTCVAMLLTALSYAHLVRDIPSAGSAFVYARRAFGARFGFLTGWTLMLDYILLPTFSYLLIGIYLNAEFQQVPASWWIFGATIAVTILNVIGVDVVRRVSWIMVIAQLAFAVVFVAAAFMRGAPPTVDPFYSRTIEWSAIFAGAAILCLSFLGFDAVSTLAEETRDPRKNVPRAILLTTVVGGMIFILLSYASALVLPDWRSIQVHDSAGLEVMKPLGTGISIFFLTAFLAGLLANALAAQASVSRILYAMGRDGVIPRRWFGRVSARFHTPVPAILTVAAVSLLTSFVTLDTLASLINFGALFAFSVVNLAVVRIFLAKGRERSPRTILLYGLCPMTGFGLTAWLWSNLSQLALIAGFCWLVAGLIYSLVRLRADLHTTSIPV